MAKMIPPIIPFDTPSYGEKEIYSLLQNDPLTHDWIVLHSLDTANHIRNIFGEVDFVIIIPNQGVLCLEVKGTTRLRHESGVWYYGNSAPDVRGPFKQSAQAMHTIRSYVSKHVPQLKAIVFWSAVAFPYVDFNEESPEWHRWQVIDRRALASRSIGELISGILDNAKKFLINRRSAAWFRPENKEPDTKQCELLASTLRPNFEIYESPKSRKHRLNEELKQYTSEQMIALDGMAKNPRAIFTGPAGSGKTLLAIETARRASLVEKTVLFICFNNFLGKLLEDQMQDLKGVVVTTLHAFLLSIIQKRAEGGDSEYWTINLPNLALEKIINADDYYQYDLLVIDEAQDIFYNPYLDVLDLSLKKGFSSGRWRIFGDFEKQNIFISQNSVTLEKFEKERCNHVPYYDLSINCRNTPRITTTVQWLGQLHPGYSKVLRPDNNINTIFEYYQNDYEQQVALTNTLEKLYEDGYKGRDIIVLSPKSNLKSCAALVSVPPWSDRLAPFQVDLIGQIGFCTIHAFKGMEAEVVVVTDIEEVIGPEAGQLFYVAMTRALNKLVIIASAAARKEIAAVIAGTSGGK